MGVSFSPIVMHVKGEWVHLKWKKTKQNKTQPDDFLLKGNLENRTHAGLDKVKRSLYAQVQI